MARPMQASDLPAAAAVSAAAFGIPLGGAAAQEGWSLRVAHAFETDPDGAVVAEREGRVVGVAEAIRRDGVWILSLLAVEPGHGSRGVGRELLAATLEYAKGADARLITSSSDPRALRLYGLAGLRLEPTFEARGRLEPDGPGGPPAEILDVTDELGRHSEALSAISIAVRGASHARELPHAVRRGARVLRLEDRGFAVAQRGHGVWLLAAHDDEAARSLLRTGLRIAGHSERALVRWITGAQDWAIEVVLECGLELVPYGALCVRGEPGPLRPYIPSPPFA